jgi:hypothetical protein
MKFERKKILNKTMEKENTEVITIKVGAISLGESTSEVDQFTTFTLNLHKNVTKKFNYFKAHKTFIFHILNEEFYIKFFKLFNDVRNTMFCYSPPGFFYDSDEDDSDEDDSDEDDSDEDDSDEDDSDEDDSDEDDSKSFKAPFDVNKIVKFDFDNLTEENCCNIYEEYIHLSHYLGLEAEYNDMIYFHVHDVVSPKIFNIGDTILNMFDIIKKNNYVDDINYLRKNIFLGVITIDNNMFIEVNNVKIYLKDLEENISTLLEHSKPSPFGFKNQTLYDTTVRSAKELKYASNEFNINFLPDIYRNTRMNMNLDKLNIYAEGDHFQVHLDTAKQNLVETLVVLLPSKFEGGELYFPNIKYSFNPQFDKNKMYFIIFPYYYPHEIKKVLSGNRTTLTFNVFKENNISHTRLQSMGKDLNYSIYYPMLHKIFNGKKNIVMSNGYKYRMFYLKFFESESYSKFYEIKKFYTSDTYNVKYDTALYSNIILHPDYEECARVNGNIVLPRLIIDDDGHSIEETYRYTYGYAGNEACSSQKEVKYCEFYVINPKLYNNDKCLFDIWVELCN